ncbi:carbohydrate esterase family 16 protein [Chiua virens]|nr:carbohydrate esterase family 16 protein [Chiua virens]
MPPDHPLSHNVKLARAADLAPKLLNRPPDPVVQFAREMHMHMKHERSCDESDAEASTESDSFIKRACRNGVSAQLFRGLSKMMLRGLFVLAASLFSVPLASAIPWNATEYLFVFGDSYSASGYNISAGINSSDPGLTSSNGPNWVEFLTNTYNQTALNTFNLAYDGATIDSALVTPYLPTTKFLSSTSTWSSKPAGAQWNSTNSLFAIWIGINDVGNSFDWTNITQFQFYGTLTDRLFSQVDDLYNAGARNFLFLTVPPINRARAFLQIGPKAVAQVGTEVMNYNTQLTQKVRDFEQNHTDLDGVTVLDTQPIFNTLLDEWQTFGFVNVTGYCAAYEGGTPTSTYQVEGWLNALHPVFTVHNILAKVISTALAGYPATQIPT